MARPATSAVGKPVANMAGGFPLFFSGRKQRVVTGDPWAFLAHLAVTKLAQPRESIALAYITQGREFFQAAANPNLTSRPLLYYYAFLNLVKASLLIKKVQLPAAAMHGISDPRANSRQRLRFEGQLVRIVDRAGDHSQLFPEFLHSLGYSGQLPRSVRILDLLRHIPNIHRTFTIVEKANPTFAPLSTTSVHHADGRVWARVTFKSTDKDVSATLPSLRAKRAFQRALHQVRSDKPDETWFETDPVPGRGRALDTGIRSLSVTLRTVGIAPLLTNSGYRFYFSTLAAGSFLPYLGAAAAVIFYLGSITRYKPDVFDKIISGRHSWVIAEFLASQPTQFLYALSSELAGVDVVKPYAVMT